MKHEGRHRISPEITPEQTVPPTGDALAPVLPSAGEALAPVLPPPVATGHFTVQFLDDHWFIGVPEAAQRIEDAATLDTWLLANGAAGRHDLDFGGDDVLAGRFWAAMGPEPTTAVTNLTPEPPLG